MGGDVGGGGERGHGGYDELKEQKYISSQTLNVTSRHYFLVFVGNFFNFSYIGWASSVLKMFFNLFNSQPWLSYESLVFFQFLSS